MLQRHISAIQSTPEDLAPETDEVRVLARVVEEIRDDAADSPGTYLDQTIVPEGGE